MPTPAEYQAAVEKVVTNSDRLDDFVNGPVGATVNTDNGSIPTIADLIADLQQQVEDGLAAATIETIPGLSAALGTLVTPSNSISSTIGANKVAWLVPTSVFNQTGIALSDHQGVLGNNAVFSSQSTTPVFTVTGFSPVIENLYFQGNTDASDFYVTVTNSRGARIRNIYGANTGFGGMKFAPTTDCGVTWLDNVFFEDVTGIGYNIGSRTSKIKANGIEAFGKLDFTGGLGKPRAGSIGWRQNTPVVGGVAVGGHQIANSNMEALEKGWWLTDAQLTKFSNCIADGTSDYGLIIDGASQDVEVADFFCGTSRGIYVGGTSTRILFNGLKTLFTGTIPPWGAADFYNGVATFYDLTVAGTASVTVNGTEWQGSKKTSVASGAKLVVTGGQRVQFNSETNVSAASTVYLKPGGGTTTTESEAMFRAELDGVLFMVQADSNNTPSSGSHVYTVRKSGVDTALTCSTTAGAYQSRAFDGGITVARGEVLSLKLVTGSGPAALHDVVVQVLQS